jgi:hypothetical protein
MAKRKPQSIMDEFMQLPDDKSRSSGHDNWLEKCQAADPERTKQIISLMDDWNADTTYSGLRKKARSVVKLWEKLSPFIIAIIGKAPGESRFRDIMRERAKLNGKK